MKVKKLFSCLIYRLSIIVYKITMNVEHHSNYFFCLDIDADNWKSDYQLQTTDLLRVKFIENNLRITLYAQVDTSEETIYFSDLDVIFNRPKSVVKLSQEEIDVVVDLMKQYKFCSSLRIEYQRQLLEHLE